MKEKMQAIHARLSGVVQRLPKDQHYHDLHVIAAEMGVALSGDAAPMPVTKPAVKAKVKK